MNSRTNIVKKAQILKNFQNPKISAEDPTLKIVTGKYEKLFRIDCGAR